MADPSVDAAREPRAPLWATFALTWVNNIGASIALMGVYFIAREAYRFTETQSLVLGLVQGLTYIVAALGAGPVVGKLAGPGRAISHRALTGTVMLFMAAGCWLPVLWRSPWSIWCLIAVYSPLSGWLWPLIESFLASGRTGADLRRTTGTFNFAWSSCQFVTFWMLAGFMPSGEAAITPEALDRVLWSLPLMGLSHVVSLVFLLALPREPGAHHELVDEALSDEQRARFRRLLVASRCLIVMSYLGYSAMHPLLPTLLEKLEMSPRDKPLVTSTWMISRVAMFALMAWWHAWQGRRSTLVWSGGLLIAGVSMVLLAPGREVLMTGLILFGLGHGSIYSAAFYYAMEVGSAGVDAGGKHEALIGCGYAIGPLAAMAAQAGVGVFSHRPADSTLAITILIWLLAATAGFFAWRAVRGTGRVTAPE